MNRRGAVEETGSSRPDAAPANKDTGNVADLVSLASVINADHDRCERLARLASVVKPEPAALGIIEREGVGPILYRHLKRAGAVDCPLLAPLRGLAIRHRHATAIRTAEFVRLSSALAAQGIPSAALKGIALAHALYPEPGLRPMRDIDFLVRPGDAGAARKLLEREGYDFEPGHPSRFMRRHHHLPNATRTVDVLRVSIEIHTEANSGDAPGRIILAPEKRPLRRVDTPDGPFHTLGHEDMLDQLCRHALEPGSRIRLLSVMDILGYAERFLDEIDWSSFRGNRAYIANFISLLHGVSPLPDTLQRFRPPAGSLPSGCGELIPTISHTARRGKLALARLATSPPEWWFRSYYGVAPGVSIPLGRRLTHALRVARCFGRRALALGHSS